MLLQLIRHLINIHMWHQILRLVGGVNKRLKISDIKD